MDAFIGIDLACAKNKHCPISICTFENGRLIPLLLTEEAFVAPRGSGNVATLNREHNYVYANEIKNYILSVCKAHNLTAKRIALDAPLTPKKHTLKRRLAEQALDRFRISCYATPSAADFENIIAKGKAHIAQGKEPSRLPHSMQIFMLAGFALAEVLEEVAEVIEIYPQANARLLSVAGKHKTKQDQSMVQLKAISEYTGWPNAAHEWDSVGNICKAPMHDKIDAYSAAWIASLPVEKRVALGSVEHNDAIWVPDLDKLERIQKVDINFSSAEHDVKLSYATKPKIKKRKPTESKMPEVCPACNTFKFKMWPFGWDTHAAHKCIGIIGSNPEERKRLFKQKYMK
jgi:predicted nuclease with RNAse H fold